MPSIPSVICGIIVSRASTARIVKTLDDCERDENFFPLRGRINSVKVLRVRLRSKSPFWKKDGRLAGFNDVNTTD
jgi:hypothetical protein